MATSYKGKIDSGRIVTDGLILYLDAANRDSYPGSGTLWSDLSGNRNTCTLSGGYSFSSSGNGSVLFNGINGYGSVPSSPSISLTTATASVWFKYTTAAGNGAEVMGKHDTSSSTNGFSIYLYNGTMQASVKNASTSYSPPVNVAVSTNVWHNAVLTFSSNSTANFYFNGSLISSAATGTLTTSAQPLRFADSVDTYWTIMGGSIGAASMYNRALSASEVLQNFSAIRGRFGV